MGKDRRERRALERGNAAAGVDNTYRKTWDKDEFAAKADQREAKVSRQLIQPQAHMRGVKPSAYICERAPLVGTGF